MLRNKKSTISSSTSEESSSSCHQVEESNPTISDCENVKVEPRDEQKELQEQDQPAKQTVEEFIAEVFEKFPKQRRFPRLCALGFSSGYSLLDLHRKFYDYLLLTNSLIEENYFPNEFHFYREDPHPDPTRLIMISEREDVPYEIFFERFRELRGWFDETCSIDDPCSKILKFFFNKNFGFGSVPTEEEKRKFHKEFAKLEAVGEELTTGHVHLLMEETFYSEKSIRHEYKQWRYQNTIKSIEPVELPQLESRSRLNFHLDYVEDHDYLENMDLPIEYIRSQTAHSFYHNTQFSAHNRHPSIREMLNIGNILGCCYLHVYDKFTELRILHNDICEPNDACQTVAALNSRPEDWGERNVTPDSWNVMRNEFGRMKFHEGDTVPLGVAHLIILETDLAMDVIQQKFKLWFYLKTKNVF